MVVDQVADDIHRIVLDKPDGLPSPADAATNIYVIDGDAPALINAGHPSQFDQLCRGVGQVGVEISEIERVIYTSWAIDSLGAAANLPNMDHFVFSPDMVEPTNYEAHIDARRRQLRARAEAVVDQDLDYTDADLEAVDDFLKAFYPPVPAHLEFIPLRSGHTICAGSATYEVIAAPGPTSGHVVLYDAAQSVLFGGRFSATGPPDEIEQVQSYLISLERLQKLDVDVLLLDRGQPFCRRGGWAIRRALRFLNNFMSNAPAAMHQAPTVLDFMHRDLGHHLDDLAECILELQRYKAPMDELVRARVIEADGEGLERRYGTDVDDDRAALRK